MAKTLQEIITNPKWVAKYLDNTIETLPETWLHSSNFNFLSFGFQLKLAGIDWRSEDDLAAVLAHFEENKIIFRDGYSFRVNPKHLQSNG